MRSEGKRLKVKGERYKYQTGQEVRLVMMRFEDLEAREKKEGEKVRWCEGEI